MSAQSTAGGQAVQKAVWALDFDGVVCNSVGESSLTAWKAAEQHWPDIFKSEQAKAKKRQVIQDMEHVRPVIETGYENLIQVRCLLEGISTDDILNKWHILLPEYMDKWQQSRKELVELFGSVRDAWIAEDLPGWLNANGIYPGLPQDLAAAQRDHELYIVTTKQARFTEALMRDKAKLNFSADRILSTAETGQPKSEVLQQLEQRHPGTTYHFVEDKLGTLNKVCQVKELDHWMLYLVDWGYNTKQERAQAADNPRIHVVNHQELSQAVRQ
ncbi:hypothetical protein ABBQ32_007501 [Trebouxia sp. C0010 RCD-2024]